MDNQAVAESFTLDNVTHRGVVRRRGLLASIVLLLCVSSFAQEEADHPPPDLRVYPKTDSPIQEVTVVVTNPTTETAILLTSVEFDGQLPELRYFLHGIYGGIRKRGDEYVHNEMAQELTCDVGTCFVLPGQSASWQRPLRTAELKFSALVTWREIPLQSVPEEVWFCAGPDKEGAFAQVYRRLTPDEQQTYRSMTCATGGTPPRVLLAPHTHTTYRATLAVPCWEIRRRPGTASGSPNSPRKSIEVRMSPLFQAITMSEDRIQVRHHDSWRGDWKPNDLPVTDRCVVDFLYLCTKKGKTVPCLLNEAQFGCMVNVQRPHTQMYYSPGITAVPFEKFRDICLRAKEKGVEIHLKRIDPNSLGQQLVLCIGRDVTDRGRPTAEPDE